eukprot:TRINITY_DN12836_c0_g1_i1.p1 TRINITY_DN12836_c0_g1~~TRINITY_DN12836_c0_g1_i1.p1  ORF type:complete len:238 (-),score=51.45 TRINITY_DN12836_c0_g1_i1:9-722(-)
MKIKQSIKFINKKFGYKGYKNSQNQIFNLQKNKFFFSTQLKQFADTYAKPLQYLHWFGAAGITFCTVTAFIAGGITKDKDDPNFTEENLKLRNSLMHNHESVGILMLAAMIPRLGARLLTKIPPNLPGNALEHFASKLSHAFLYFVVVFMPISGFAFGYFSCWGVPFFKWNVPGADQKYANDPTYESIWKWFYEKHHQVGSILNYVLPIHVGATAYHVLKGHQIFRRMNPFAKAIKN